MDNQMTVVVGTLLVLFFGIALIVYALEFRKRQNQHIRERAAIKINFEQALLKSQLEIQEQTFKSISLELHDDIGQVLSLSKLNLNSINYAKEGNCKEQVADSIVLITNAIQSIRDLAKSLNTDFISKLGLMDAIQVELNRLERTGTSNTSLTITGEQQNLDPQVELILFRILQEAIHNIIKHARASTITIKANFANDHLSLNVIDNGKGFDVSSKDGEGSGLSNMASRSNLLQAAFKIKSSAGVGTEISIDLPLHANISINPILLSRS